MKQFFTTCLLVLTLACTGQNYGNNWFFGDHAGINFSSCNPIASLEGSNTGFEGCSSISNANGQLLFYTNSDVVWNSSHQPMPNGNLLTSSGTLSQVLIIPQPQSSTIYYIITTKVQAQGVLTLRYHTVDMSLNAGLGDVVSANNVITTTNVTEQIAATYHSNGTDIWIMTHEYLSNNFMAFLVTSSGISLTPVISSVGNAQATCNSNMNARGEIKFSPDGSLLAFNANGIGGNPQTNLLMLCFFSNSTGVVSNPLNLPFSQGEFGLSFSPDNSKLYGTTWKAFAFTQNDYNYIYQFDLTSGNPTTIINSKYILDSALVPTSYGDIKLAPDGRIYIASYNAYSLGVIQYPNLPGASCGYQANGLYLGGRQCKFGLNNYIEYTNYCTPTDVANDLVYESSTQVYPNPFHTATTLYLANPLREERSFLMYDAQGRLVREITNTTDERLELQRDGLSAGIYFFHWRSARGIVSSGKLMID